MNRGCLGAVVFMHDQCQRGKTSKRQHALGGVQAVNLRRNEYRVRIHAGRCNLGVTQKGNAAITVQVWGAFHEGDRI